MPGARSGIWLLRVMVVDFAATAREPPSSRPIPYMEDIDLARLSLEIEGAMGEVVALVDAVFSVKT